MPQNIFLVLWIFIFSSHLADLFAFISSKENTFQGIKSGKWFLLRTRVSQRMLRKIIIVLLQLFSKHVCILFVNPRFPRHIVDLHEADTCRRGLTNLRSGSIFVSAVAVRENV